MEDSPEKGGTGQPAHSGTPPIQPNAPPPADISEPSVPAAVSSPISSAQADWLFPVNDPRCQLWKDCTREVEKDIAKHRPGLLRESPMSFGKLAKSRMVEAVTAFDIWTWRTLAIVIGDADIGGYDRWLLAYANIMIECASTPQWMGPMEISEIRRQIAERVEVRKAGARERAAMIKSRAKSDVDGWG